MIITITIYYRVRLEPGGLYYILERIRESIKEHEFWIGAFMAKYRKISIVIIAVYRSPSGQKAEFCEALNEFLDIVCEGNYQIVIAGDFNNDDNSLKQIMYEFTRITRASKTLIDYIITKIGNK